MADDWYHIAHTPSGVHVHRLNAEQMAIKVEEIRMLNPDTSVPDADALAVGHFVGLIRAELSFPDNFMITPGWQSTVSPGEPHLSLMAQSILHEEMPEAV